MRQPLVRLLVLLSAVTLLFAACGDDDDSGSGSVSGTGSGSGTGAGADFDLVKSGTLTVCSDVPYAPFEYEDGGDLKGIDVDLVTAIAEKLDLEASFRDTDFDGIFAAMAAGNCDMVASSVSITEERKKTMLFSDGYFEINQSMLVRKGDEGKYKDFADLKGKTIGVQSETTGADFAKENGEPEGVSIKEFTGADELFTALRANQIDAVVQDYPINAYNATTTGETVVSKRFTEGEPEEYGFAFDKDNEALRDAVNEALNDLRDDGTYDEILKEYLGDEATS